MKLRMLCFSYYQSVFLFCITLLYVTTLATTSKNYGGNETDHSALLAFKLMITRDPQGVVSSWNDSLHFCEWEGVTCGRRHRRVTILDLSSRGLVGTLSPYIGNLSFLRKIKLSNNTLQGKLPNEVSHLFRLQILHLANNSLVGEIPANLSHCTNLTYLNLGRNKLIGKIPWELTSLTNLKALGIHFNNLVGGITPFLGNLTSLEQLSASYNPLGGSIPDALGQLTHLTALGLAGNNLSGMIPSSIYNLSSITIFAVSENQLHGRLPPTLGLTSTLPRIEDFQISANFFGGSIPVSLSNASKLVSVAMFSNHFTGKLSVNFERMQNLSYLNFGLNNLGSGEADEMSFLNSLANCTHLQTLTLSVNQFKGVLPNSIANLSTKLESFIINRNQLYGSIPSGIGNLVSLTLIGMERNQFTGTIPPEISKLQKLRWLALFKNNLSGKIPFSLGNLSLLDELRLNNNKLQGTIPSSLGKCHNLKVLNLFQNNLSGIIPKEIFDISYMSLSLNLAQNRLVGSLPSQVGNLESLMSLDVSENKLSGGIPSSLGDCAHLENLNMEGNFFQGSIPPSLSSLRGIQSLDLSRNNLSGLIPTFLENLYLKTLNLSYNNFEGELPMKGVFANASAISVVGNSRLCGGISELQFPSCSPRESEKRKLSLVHIIVISTVCMFMAVIMVSTLVLCWFKRRRKQQSSGSSVRKSFLKMSYQMLLKATDGFSVANLVGVGSFGSVYKGILDQDGTTFAVKVLNLQRRGASKSFMAECEALRNIRHRNLLKIITSCSSVDFQGNDFKALVYEFMPNGSLERWLHRVPEREDGQPELQNLNLRQRINTAIDVACALDYLHQHCQNPIVHCDLKPSNVLLDGEMTAHVGDFGLARILPVLTNPHQSSSVGIRGTIGYAAPEYGLGSEVSTKGDVYSYGIILLEMMTGKRPTDSMFEDGLNLHCFASMALPDRVLEIVDPILLNNDEDESSNYRSPARVTNANRREECLISIVKIGVACSMELPQDRMDISNALNELYSVRDVFLRTRILAQHA